MDKTLSINEAYSAMYSYLESLFKRTGSDYLGGLLGDMSLLQDGSTADPAIWNDWLQAIEKVRRGEVDPTLKLSR
jgi:hypothetical protein